VKCHILKGDILLYIQTSLFFYKIKINIFYKKKIKLIFKKKTNQEGVAREPPQDTPTREVGAPPPPPPPPPPFFRKK
jgi:hypothetical protein